MGLDIGRFKRVLSRVGRVGLDTPVPIYHLEDIHPYAELTTHMFAEASAGLLQTRFLSVVTLAEILLKSWQEGDAGRAAPHPHSAGSTAEHSVGGYQGSGRR